MATEPNYYAVLGVSPDSEDIVIQAAYRALMRRYHPDRNPSTEAARKTIEINAAYAVLGNSGARAAYEGRRKASANQKSGSGAGAKPPPPPSPPPQPPKTAAGKSPPPTGKIEPERGKAGGLVFASILTISIIVSIGLAGSKASDNANNTMNVDENLTTTDITATDMNAMKETELNSVEVNAVEALAPDLSKQSQTAVSYSTIEGAAKRLAKILTTKGVLGARAYSESCHKAVQTTPAWDSADSCAAFDYAAAFVDGAVSTQNGWPKDGYFQFQSANESDNYSAVGAATFMTNDRLSKIRAAAQDAAVDAYRMELARRSASAGTRADQPTAAAASASGNSSE